jgi:hypothetical protein
MRVLFRQLRQLRESFRFAHGEIGQRLAVQVDPGMSKASDESRV